MNVARSIDDLFTEARRAAEETDWFKCRAALTNYLAAFRDRYGSSPQTLPADDKTSADTRLKLTQLWLAIDGKNRYSVTYLMDALKFMPDFVEPPTAEHELDQFMRLYGSLLAKFEKEYSAEPVDLSFWKDWLNPRDAMRYRGEVFVSQATAWDPGNFGMQALRDAYYLEYLYASSVDHLGALRLFEDDGAFEALRFNLEGTIVSRDILDSVLELNFIAKHCGMRRKDSFVLIDVGAGYGRLVSRALSLFQNGEAYALDAVPFSSFTCEHYLTFRGLSDRAKIGNIANLRDVRGPAQRVAVNIHSWSEAPMRSIERWLDALLGAKIQWLLLVTPSARPESFEMMK